MTPGIHNISNEQYHSSNGISRSMIMDFMKSPKHYWYKYLSGAYIKPKPTEDMLFGEAVHTWLLEGHTFHDKYRAYDKKERRSNAGKQYYESECLAASATNRNLISIDDCERIKAIGYAVDEDVQIKGLIEDAQYEQSIYWQDIDTGLLCKCRPDIWGNGYIADIKTTNDASYNSFQYSALKYGYDVQCAMIREGIKNVTGEVIENFVLIAIEKEPPYISVCYPMDNAMIDAGYNKFKEALNYLANCIDGDYWPGYEVQTLMLPEWRRL